MVRVVVAEDMKPVGGEVGRESHIVRLGLTVAGRDDDERSARLRFQGAVLAGRDATAVARQPFHLAAEDLDHVGPVVSLAAERKKLPDQFGECRSEEHTSELQSPYDLVCRLLLEKK